MGFRDLDVLLSYNSSIHDILNEFYIKVLSEAVSYKRIAGFFSSTSLAVSARGISGLINNKGNMQLLVSPKLSSQDIEIIEKATKNPEEIIQNRMLNEIERIHGIEGLIEKDYIIALGWLLANSLLEIKVATVYDNDGKLLDHEELKKSGLFHMKVGILEDKNGDVISFSGSINETASAWINNVEEFKVFKQWELGQSDYCNSDIKKFDLYWNDLAENVKVYRMPEAVEKKIIKMVPNNYDINKVKKARNKDENYGLQINLFDYQKKAIKLWNKYNYSMIFEMATGTGKTIAAIGCMTSVIHKKAPIVFFIICPQSTLLLQWKDDIETINLKHDEYVIADSTNRNWRNELENLLLSMQVGKYKTTIVYSTFDTYCSRDFINIIVNNKKNINYMIIADEVHGLGSKKRSEGLLHVYNLRLGLSATPERWFDEIGTNRIINYFSDNKFEFDIHDALTTINPLTGRTYLTPYKYIPLFTNLEDEEIENYNELTKKISGLSVKAKSDSELEDVLENIIFQRANIHKSAINKYKLIEKIFDEMGDDVEGLIIFLSDNQINKVVNIASSRNIRVHKFTQSKGVLKSKDYGGRTEREDIIKKFIEKDYQALLAIKCLDEGIDIPSAKTAILMSSSTNPREYIQRIGRVIRRFPNPEVEIINKEYELICKAIDENKKNIEQISDQLTTCKNRLAQINSELGDEPDIEELEHERNQLNIKIQITDCELTEAENDQKHFIRKYTVILNALPKLKRLYKIIEKKDKNKQLPPRIDREELKKMIEMNNCTICNRELDHSGLIHINYLLEQYQLSNQLATLLTYIMGSIQILINEAEKYPEEKRKILTLVKTIEDKKEELVNTYNDIQSQLLKY
jgi:superfamily II DNA or RNA helicase